MPLRTILVPVDFSKASRHAFEAALDLARDEWGEIHLLHACEPPGLRAALPAAADTLPASGAQTVDGVRERLEAWLADGRLAGVPCHAHVVEGDPREAIVREAAARKADVVVLNRGGCDLPWDGVVEHVMRRAPCSVLLVPDEPPEPRRE